MRNQVCSALVAVLFAATVNHAQTTNATLVGSIIDSSTAAVADAVIKVTNTGTGAVREASTDVSGSYRITPLPPGTYDVTVSKSGFQTYAAKNIKLDVAAIVKLDVELTVGAVTETVNVTAFSPILQTQEASTGTLVTRDDVARMPVNGRNFTRLILLMPGSSDQGSSQTRGVNESGTQLISVNGQRRQDNNLTLDGIDNNFMMMNSPGLSPPMDSLQEFRVATNNSAEYGRSAGANVNLAVRSGTRNLHGTAYEFLRNDKFDANEFFANRQSRGKVPFRQNQYGVAFGGPVWIPKIYHGQDKTFWFVNWEGYRRRRGTTAISTSPVADQRSGDFSQQPRPIFDPLTTSFNELQQPVRQQFPGNRIPNARVSPAVKLFLDTYMPLPNQPGLANNLLNTESLRNDRDSTVMRFDHQFSTKDSVFVRYLYQRAGLFNPSANPLFYSESRFDGHNLGVSWNHLFSSSTILELKFGYNSPINPNLDIGRALTRKEFLEKAGIKMFQIDVLSDTRPPEFNAVGEFTYGGGGDVTSDDIYQAVGNISTTRGKHAFKFGGDYSRRHFFTNTANPMNGNLLFDTRLTSTSGVNNSGHSFATMLLGYPTEVRRGQGNTLTQGRINSPQFYFQDDWRITRKLTLNLGVRYQFQNAPYDLTDRLGNLVVSYDPATGRSRGILMWATTNPEIDPDTGKPNQPAKTLGNGRALMKSDYNNWAPRVGLAYQMNGKTVLRSAYGIFYNSTFVQELQDLRKFWPFTVQQVFTPNTDRIPDLSLTDAGPSFSNTSAIGGWPQNPDNRTPYSQQWNVSVQRQILNDMSFEVGYVGNGNRKQVGYTAINSPLTPGPGPVNPRRLMPEYSDLDGGANRFPSNYHSLQTKLVKRFSRGLQFNFNYTWGKVLDYQSSLAEWKTQDPFHIKNDYGPSSIDINHAVNFSSVWDLPFGKDRALGAGWNSATNFVLGGWTLDGFVHVQTGRPYNVLSGRDVANVGRTYQRPNVSGDPNTGPKTPDQWFNTSVFTFPEPFTYGNAGSFIVRGDRRHTWDIALGKHFYFLEKHRIEFRSEFYNAFNKTQLGDPNTNLSSTAFGQVTSAAPNRQIQFALRYAF